MPLNQSSIFPPSRNINVTFDWIDIAAGTGYNVFDGFNAKDSTGNNYILIDNASNLTSTYTLGDGHVCLMTTDNTAGVGKKIDVDFDMTAFQKPRTIEGNAFVRINLWCNTLANVYSKAIFRKWDGATETDLVTTQSPTDVLQIPGDSYSWTLKLVVPRTVFKAGEQVRLTIEVYTDGGAEVQLGHNPRDQAIGSSLKSGASRLVIAVPFKLDI